MYDKARAALLAVGTVAVIPTDTVYGLVARAEDKAAVARLYEIKNRDNKPGTVIAADINQLETLGIKHRYLAPLQEYWPGPISVVVPLSGEDLYYLSLDHPTLAVRIPRPKALRELLKATGPLLSTSANAPGKKPAATVAKAKKYFGSNVDVYIDGGDLKDKQPSTIIRIIDDAVEVIRRGEGQID